MSPWGGKTLKPSVNQGRGPAIDLLLWKPPLMSDSIMAHLVLTAGMASAWTPRTVLFLLPHAASSKTGELPSSHTLGC